MPVEASETCRGMAEAIAALTLLRDRYKAAGKLIAARTVERCIAVVRRIDSGGGCLNALRECSGGESSAFSQVPSRLVPAAAIMARQTCAAIDGSYVRVDISARDMPRAQLVQRCCQRVTIFSSASGTAAGAW